MLASACDHLYEVLSADGRTLDNAVRRCVLCGHRQPSGFEALAAAVATVDAQTEIGRLRQSLFVAEATADQLRDTIAALERRAVEARAEIAALTGQRDRALADSDRWAAAAIESRDALAQLQADLAEGLRMSTMAKILAHEIAVKLGVSVTPERARDLVGNMLTYVVAMTGVHPIDQDEPATEVEAA